MQSNGLNAVLYDSQPCLSWHMKKKSHPSNGSTFQIITLRSGDNCCLIQIGLFATNLTSVLSRGNECCVSYIMLRENA